MNIFVRFSGNILLIISFVHIYIDIINKMMSNLSLYSNSNIDKNFEPYYNNVNFHSNNNNSYFSSHVNNINLFSVDNVAKGFKTFSSSFTNRVVKFFYKKIYLYGFSLLEKGLNFAVAPRRILIHDSICDIEFGLRDLSKASKDIIR